MSKKKSTKCVHSGGIIDDKFFGNITPIYPSITYDYLNSDAYPNQTCIGLTEDTDYHGVIYKYGEVTIPDEKKLLDNEHLQLKFKYDILENNGIPKENFGDDFFKLIGDILYHIIIAQSEVGYDNTDDRTNNIKQSSVQ